MAIPVSRGEGGPSGLAQINLIDGGKVTVTFKEGQNAGYPIVIFKDDVPSFLQSGTYFVRMNNDSSQIYSVRPAVAATYTMQFLGFIKDKDGMVKILDVPKRDGTRADGKSWSIPAHQEFLANMRIVSDGQYKGVEMAKNLSYCFVEYNDTGLAQLKGTGTRNVENFLESAGINFETDEIRMDTPHTLLIQLEAVLLSRSRYFTAEVNAKGYIGKMSALPDDIVKMMREMNATPVEKMSTQELTESLGFGSANDTPAPTFKSMDDVPRAVLMKVVAKGIKFESDADTLVYINSNPDLYV